MPTTYRKKQLFEDAAKENGVYPVTVTEAVFNNGGDTLDDILQDLSDLIDEKAEKCLVITSSSFFSLPQTITDANITSDHVVANSVLSNPSAQTGNWTVTTSNGSLTISGSIGGSTTVTLYLIEQRS